MNQSPQFHNTITDGQLDLDVSLNKFNVIHIELET